MRNMIALCLLPVLMGAGPTSRPVDEVARLQSDADNLRAQISADEKRLDAMREAITARLKESPEYTALASALAASEKRVADLESGDAVARLNAKTDMREAKRRLDALVPAALAADTECAALARSIDFARGKLGATTRRAVEAAEEARMADPIYRAMKERRLVVGMTIAQARQAAGSDGVLVEEGERHTVIRFWGESSSIGGNSTRQYYQVVTFVRGRIKLIEKGSEDHYRPPSPSGRYTRG